MQYNKIFRPAVIVLIAVNLVTVVLLAANKVNDFDKGNKGEVEAYVEALDDEAIKEKKSVLAQDDVEEVSIEANTDLGLITEAPIAAKVGKEVLFTVNGTYSGDVMKVRGLNDYEIVLEMQDYGEYSWTPERAGVFEMALLDRQGNERVTRRINVASEDREDFYELTPLEYNLDRKNNVTFTTSIFNQPTGNKKNQALPTTAFTIGEAGMWHKTIKSYATSENDADRAKTSIVEGKDFLMDRGNYTITASLKDLYSVDAEDTKSISYEKKPIDGHKVVIDDIEVVSKKNEEGQDVEQFIVHARCEHDKSKEPEDCDLVYAFSVDDSVGTKNIVGTLNGYTENNELTIPNIKWTYTVTVKVKHKNNSDTEALDDKLLLPNAYEVMATKNVVKVERDPYEEIVVKNVKIQSSLLDDYYADENKPLLPTQMIADETQIGTMYVNSNNYITVNVGENEKPEKLQYSATITQNGQSFTLEPVYESKDDKVGNTFVYYPKTGGSKSYNPNQTATLTVVVAELNNDGSMVRRTVKNIEVNIK